MEFSISSELVSLTALVAEAFKHVPEIGFFVKDPEGRFVRANSNFIKLCWQKKEEEVLGRNDLDFFDAKCAAIYTDDDRKVLSTGSAIENHCEPMPYGKSGGAPGGFVLTTKIPVKDGQGRVLGLMGIVRNIGEVSQHFESIQSFGPVIDYLDRLKDEPVEIPKLAAMVGMSVSGFGREFKKVFGMTPSAYGNQLRLRRARSQVISSRLPLGEIALENGFYDQSHFTKRFSAMFGITPKKLRAASMASRKVS